MDTTQIYSIVNEVTAQAMGQSAINVVDTSSLVALGNTVLNSSNNTEPWLNTLVQRIGKTIVEGRAYYSQFRSFVKGDMEWGVILQKISVDLPDASEEEAVELVDGESIDMYKVNKPVAHQHFFVSRTPYKIWVTIQRHFLEEAFTSESAMESFISTVFMKVQNKLELAVENLTRAAINNYIGIASAQQEIKLVSEYNGIYGTEIATGERALADPAFLRWAIGRIKEIGYNMTFLSTLYNTDAEERHTPFNRQKLLLLNRFRTAIDTVALATTFNDEYLKMVENFIVPYWQGSGSTLSNAFPNISKVNVKVQSGEETTSVEKSNIVGVLADTEAVGMYRKRRATVTTPLNASGLYTNTYWHENQMWFNDTAENFIYFTLN